MDTVTGCGHGFSNLPWEVINLEPGRRPSTLRLMSTTETESHPFQFELILPIA